MASGTFRFAGFELDPADRRLSRGGVPVELNARYLDALALLVGEPGRLVSKDRFLDEVWRGVPVTDEALTQCIKTLRRQLGDDAANPRFIETVPKHGYRFIAGVESDVERSAPTRATAAATPWSEFLWLGAAGTGGGVVAGLIGGLIYGFVGASQADPGTGALSVLLVLVAVTMAVALLGGAGVGLGIAAAGLTVGRGSPWAIVGGALGGLIVGALVKLVGLDAFTLLVGRTPGDITGAPEGALLGAAIGLAARPGGRGSVSARRAGAWAALAGGTAGALIPLLGGRLLLGSLDLLARDFPGSRLRLDSIGALFGESGLGLVSQAMTGALEGALFGGCLVGAMTWVRRSAA